MHPAPPFGAEASHAGWRPAPACDADGTGDSGRAPEDQETHRDLRLPVPTKSPQLRADGIGAHKKPTDETAQSGMIRHGMLT
jgi:hypothetical protein